MEVNPSTGIPPNLKFDSHIAATLEVLPEKFFSLLKPGRSNAKGSVTGLNTVSEFGREGLMQVLLSNCIILI